MNRIESVEVAVCAALSLLAMTLVICESLSVSSFNHIKH